MHGHKNVKKSITEDSSLLTLYDANLWMQDKLGYMSLDV
jgi:hypothetical protein